MRLMKQIYLLFAVLILTVVFGESVVAQSNNQTSQPETNKTDTPLKVKKKPHPRARGCQPGNGRMQIKVTFDKSGVVSDLLQISESGCDPFDRSALNAAKKIEFEPATKDGIAVTVVKTVEYAYGIY